VIVTTSGGDAFALCANGRRIYFDPSDQRGQRLAARGGDFNPPARHIWQTLLAERPWTHVIDVGANYGEMLLGVTLPRAANVIAMEPSPFVLHYLHRSLHEAGLAVEVIEKAASARSGTAILSADRDWSGNSSLNGAMPEAAGHTVENVEIEAITLASLLKDRGIPGSIRLLLKVDVETHEIQVLQGLENTVDRLEEFAAMIEISHLDMADLAWLLAHFEIELLDTRTFHLVSVGAITVSKLLDLRDRSDFYRHDAVLRRRRSGTGA
jgi:FkbM family methyltransferase